MKAFRRTWNAYTKMWESQKPMFSNPIEFLNQFITTNVDYNMEESPSIMGNLCRTFTWFSDSLSDRYVVVNTTKNVTTARLFIRHELRAEHVWYH